MDAPRQAGDLDRHLAEMPVAGPDQPVAFRRVGARLREGVPQIVARHLAVPPVHPVREQGEYVADAKRDPERDRLEDADHYPDRDVDGVIGESVAGLVRHCYRATARPVRIDS